MELKPVESGHIEAIGWEDEVLVVRFKSGKEYAWQGISYNMYHAILEAPSVGRAINLLGKGSAL